MKITVDENNHVTGFVVVGAYDFEIDDNHVPVELLTDPLLYDYIDGELVLNEDRKLENVRNEIRYRREKECFPIVNRGDLWYSRLSVEQMEELDMWYQAWLDAPETLIAPEAPEWI